VSLTDESLRTNRARSTISPSRITSAAMLVSISRRGKGPSWHGHPARVRSVALKQTVDSRIACFLVLLAWAGRPCHGETRMVGGYAHPTKCLEIQGVHHG